MRISAKDLGAMALDDFCPRCFYIKRNVKKLPFQIFPGIFSSIDSFTKKVVHHYIDIHKSAPPWIQNHCPFIITGYEKVPHWSKFKWEDPETGITLSGVMDDVLTTSRGVIIPDYKTAKYTANQDKLIPMYRVQLNGYAMIYEALNDVPVISLPLYYCEPQTNAVDIEGHRIEGFSMNFDAKALMVERNFQEARDLLKKAKAILDGDLPEPTEGCKDCEALANITDFQYRKFCADELPA